MKSKLRELTNFNFILSLTSIPASGKVKELVIKFGGKLFGDCSEDVYTGIPYGHIVALINKGKNLEVEMMPFEKMGNKFLSRRFHWR